MGARIPIRRSHAAEWSRRAGALSVPLLVVGGLAHRAGLVPTSSLVAVLAAGFLVAVLALALCIYAWADIWESGAEGGTDAAFGFAYALPALGLLALVLAGLAIYPRVNDVTTDIDNPPEIAGLDRTDEPAGAAPGPPSLVTGISGRLYDLPVDQVYAAVKSLVTVREWQIVRDEPPVLPGPEVAPGGILLPVPRPASDPDGAFAAEPPAPEPPAIIEAIARTWLLAIPDHVAIRLQPTPDGVAVDMRSASATGRHDLGGNGRRIKAFLNDLDLIFQGRGGLVGGGQSEPLPPPPPERP